MQPNGGAIFNYVLWAMRYPELAAFVSQPLAQMYFNEATVYVDNSRTTIISNCNSELSTLLNMVTAHIAALNAPLGGQASSSIVGRINSATEGSVTVSSEMKTPGSNSEAWFNQTKYGAAYWQAISKYRTMQYVPGCVRRANPWV